VAGNSHIEVVKSIQIENEIKEIDVSDLEPGQYTITWKSTVELWGNKRNLPLTKATLII